MEYTDVVSENYFLILWLGLQIDTTNTGMETSEGLVTGSGPVKPAEQGSEGTATSVQEKEAKECQISSSTASENDRSSKVGGGQNKGKTEKAAVSKPAAPLKKVPNRPGITWQVGERIEAMDYLSKWCAISFFLYWCVLNNDCINEMLNCMEMCSSFYHKFSTRKRQMQNRITSFSGM